MKIKKMLERLARWRLTVPQLVAIGLMVGVFAIGLVTVLQRVGTQVTSVVHNGGNSAKTAKTPEVLGVNKADFAYLVPSSNDAWKFDPAGAVYDKASGIVKYTVQLTYAGTRVTFSQQKFPDQLKPRDSSKFNNFVDSFNPARTQSAGKGMIYYKTALQNGAPANGSNTIMFATDGVLMFGQAGDMLGYDAWSKLMATMHPH